MLGGALLAFAYRTEYLGRAGVAAAPAVLAVSLLISAIGVSRSTYVVWLLAAGTAAAALAVAVPRRLLPWALVALVLAYLVVLVGWTDVSSFAAIGARPDGGGRFYGATNLVETVLLAVSLEAAWLLGPRSIPWIAGLALVTLGWSRAGADGGGIVVLLAAFGTLAAEMYRVRPTVRRVALALVGVAAILGGVRRHRCGHGRIEPRHARLPSRAGLAHRRPRAPDPPLSGGDRPPVGRGGVFGVSIAALAILATRPPRFPAGDALLVGIAVSLLVNDSPGDIASAGALSYAVIWAYERTRSVDSRAWVAES